MFIRLNISVRRLGLLYPTVCDMFFKDKMDDVSTIEKTITSDLNNLFAGIFSSVIILIILFFYNWRMARCDEFIIYDIKYDKI